MKRALVVATMAMASSFFACGENQPTPGDFLKINKVSRYHSDAELADCSEARHLIPVSGSYMKWQVVKTKDGVDSKLVGTNSVDGIWRIWGDDMRKSQAEFEFDASSTATADGLRDDRVKNVVFGLAQSMPFVFKLDSLEATEGADNVMKMPDGSAVEMMAKGSLEIYGRKALLNFPMIVKEQGGVYTITPKEMVHINVRAMMDGENQINLAEHVAHVLTFVSGVTMKDTVTVDFSLAMKNECKKAR